MYNRSLDFLSKTGLNIPIIQAPMAGADTPRLAAAVSRAGGLGSLGCALLSTTAIRQGCQEFQRLGGTVLNLNFFCHQQLPDDPDKQAAWAQRLESFYNRFGIDPHTVGEGAARVPFNDEYCLLVEELRPKVVSFHFGLPSADLVNRVKAVGCIVLSSATTVAEAAWLDEHGADAIIAQGLEAGGHRGVFLADDPNDQATLASQQLLENLLPAILQNVSLPVIAAGGIADAAGVKKALNAGAVAAQIGTAYLYTSEANVSALHLEALRSVRPTALTNIFTGRPARAIRNRLLDELGPITPDAPVFPYASRLIAPLRKASEQAHSFDCVQMWSGMNRVPHRMDAESFTRSLV